MENVIPETPAEIVPPEAELLAPEPQEKEAIQEPTLEPKAQPPHPLRPGGMRFEQVYAQGKQAQREVTELREAVARIEAENAALRSGVKVAAPEAAVEYSWAELDTFIQQGRITRADAEAHRESILERKLSKKVKEDFRQETTTLSREQSLTQSIQEYMELAPEVLEESSAARHPLICVHPLD